MNVQISITDKTHNTFNFSVAGDQPHRLQIFTSNKSLVFQSDDFLSSRSINNLSHFSFSSGKKQFLEFVFTEDGEVEPVIEILEVTNKHSLSSIILLDFHRHFIEAIKTSVEVTINGVAQVRRGDNLIFLELRNGLNSIPLSLIDPSVSDLTSDQIITFLSTMTELVTISDPEESVRYISLWFYYSDLSEFGVTPLNTSQKLLLLKLMSVKSKEINRTSLLSRMSKLINDANRLKTIGDIDPIRDFYNIINASPLSSFEDFDYTLAING